MDDRKIKFCEKTEPESSIKDVLKLKARPSQLWTEFYLIEEGKLEQMIINTLFFNRLHDVNQSSTVYLTFPPNRTKRYEHSLGAMQLTSDIFYNAAMNSAGDDAMKMLMKKAENAFMEIIEYINRKCSLIKHIMKKGSAYVLF